MLDNKNFLLHCYLSMKKSLVIVDAKHVTIKFAVIDYKLAGFGTEGAPLNLGNMLSFSAIRLHRNNEIQIGGERA